MAAISELDADECMSLLRPAHFGRVGFVSDGVPVILPVNYVLDGNTIVFRTDPGLKLAEIPMRHVAFEIDNATDADAWSVLVQGFAREDHRTPSGRRVRGTPRRPDPRPGAWRQGALGRRRDPTLSGRRIR